MNMKILNIALCKTLKKNGFSHLIKLCTPHFSRFSSFYSVKTNTDRLLQVNVREIFFK